MSLTIVRNMFAIVIVLTVVGLGIRGQNLMSDHMTNYNNNLKLESRIMNSPPIDNYIKFPEDRIDSQSAIASGYKLMPAYNLPDEIFNDGRPFYVDKDPETGRPDFSTKRTSLIDDRLPESAQELRLTNINYLTPNFHDYLNLPTKYNPEKFLYPIISSSYANMKIQGNTVKSSSISNHKEVESSGGSKRPQTVEKNETVNLLRRPATMTTTAAPKTTSVMKTAAVTAATTTTTTTTTTMKPKKTSSFIEQLFESFVDENENDDQSNSPIKPRIEEDDNENEEGDGDNDGGSVAADADANDSSSGSNDHAADDNDDGNEYDHSNYEDNEPDNKRFEIGHMNVSTNRSDDVSAAAAVTEPTTTKSSQSEIVHLEDIFKDLNEYSTISYNNEHGYDEDGDEPESGNETGGDGGDAVVVPNSNADVKETDLVTVKAYTVKSTTERRSGGDNPNIVLSVVSRVVPSVEEPAENSANDQNTDDENVQIVTKETNESQAIDPMQFPAANSQGFVNVAPHQDTVSLVLGQKESVGAGYKPESVANEPNNFINRRSDVTLGQQQNSIANDLNILSLNSKPFSHQLPIADNFGAPPAVTQLQFKGWDTVPVLYPAKLYIEQRLPPPNNLPNMQPSLYQPLPPPPPPLKNLPNILPQFKPNNRLRPQFLSEFYPGPKAPPRGGHPQRRFHLQRDRYPQGNDRKRFDDNRVIYQSQPQSSLVPPAVQQLPPSMSAMKPIHYPAGSQPLPPHPNIRSNDQLFVDEESGLYKEPPKILALDSNNEVKTLQMLKNHDSEVKTAAVPATASSDKEQAANLQKNPLYVVYPSVPESATISDSASNRLAEKFSTAPLSGAEQPLVSSSSTTTTTTTTAPSSSSAAAVIVTQPITTENPNQSRVTLKIGNAYDQINHHKPVFEVYANNQNSPFGFKKSPTPSFDANYYMNNKNYYPKAGEAGQSAPVSLDFEAPFFPSTSYDLNREPWKVVDSGDNDDNDPRRFQERSDTNIVAALVTNERSGDASKTNAGNDNESINVNVSSGSESIAVASNDPVTKTVDANSFSPQYEGGFQPIFPDSEPNAGYETPNANINTE